MEYNSGLFPFIIRYNALQHVLFPFNHPNNKKLSETRFLLFMQDVKFQIVVLTDCNGKYVLVLYDSNCTLRSGQLEISVKMGIYM